MALTETWLQQVIDNEVEGVELVSLEQVGGGQGRTVRLYIDHEGGVSHDLCGRVSEAVGRALDEVDAYGGSYTLEVSSPGIERPLRKREHFEAQVGKLVYVRCRIAVQGKRVWQGRLLDVRPQAIVVQEQGHQVVIRLSDIQSSHLVYEFE